MKWLLQVLERRLMWAWCRFEVELMIKNIFLFIGIYATVADTWRAYEYVRYKKITPRDKDTIIAFILSLIIYLNIK